MHMKILLNGHTLSIDPGTSLAELIDQQAIAPNSIATAVNDQFIPRTQRQDYALSEGDRVFTFTPITGG